MKKIMSLVSIVLIFFAFLTVSVFAEENNNKAIEIVKKEGIMNNFRDGSFHEDSNVYVAELSVILWRIYGEDNTIDAPEVLKGVWCSKEFNWARAQFGFYTGKNKPAHYQDILSSEALEKLDEELALKLGEPKLWAKKEGFVKRGELAKWAVQRHIGSKKFLFRGIMTKQEILTAEVVLLAQAEGLKTEVFTDKTTNLRNLLNIKNKKGEILKFEVYKREEVKNNKCKCDCKCSCGCNCGCNCKKSDIKKVVYEYWYQVNGGKGKEVKKDDIDKLLRDFAK